MIRLDVRYLFQLAGGPKGLIELLAKYAPKVSVNYAAVQMWHQREVVPARFIPLLLYVMSREGHAVLSLFTDDEELNGDAHSGS